MLRSASLPRAAAAALALLAAPLPAAAGPAEDAAALNDEGKQLFAAEKREAALAKFEAAVAIDARGKYLFNVCYTLGFLERYQEAIAACERTKLAADADAGLLEKTDKALASLRAKAPAQGSDGGDPTQPGQDGQPGPGPEQGPPVDGGGPAIENDPFAARPPRPAYRWSVGVELGGAVNNGIGKRDEDEQFAPSGVDLRLFSNILLSQRLGIGVQGVLGFSFFAPGDDTVDDQRLSVLELGGGLFKHFALGERLLVTPLVGVAVTSFQPGEASQGFIGIGARGELGIDYLFGPNGEHALGLRAGYSAFSEPTGEVDGLEAEAFSLDQASGVATFGLAYQFRFSTPFGPILTLE